MEGLLFQALVLLKLEQGEQLGLIVGGVSSGLLLVLNLKRSFDTGTFSLPACKEMRWHTLQLLFDCLFNRASGFLMIQFSLLLQRLTLQSFLGQRLGHCLLAQEPSSQCLPSSSHFSICPSMSWRGRLGICSIRAGHFAALILLQANVKTINLRSMGDELASKLHAF